MLDDKRYLVLIGMKIKNYRQMRRMSQQELAEKVGYTNKGMISQVESGKVNLAMDKLAKIAKALNVPLYDLMKEEIALLDSSNGQYKTVTFTHDPFDGLDDEDMKKVAEYIKMLKGARAWQNQNGTDKDGDTASRSTAKLGPTLQEIPDEEADLMFSKLQSESPDSRQSKRSGRHGKDTSLRLMR